MESVAEGCTNVEEIDMSGNSSKAEQLIRRLNNRKDKQNKTQTKVTVNEIATHLRD